MKSLADLTKTVVIRGVEVTIREDLTASDLGQWSSIWEKPRVVRMHRGFAIVYGLSAYKKPRDVYIWVAQCDQHGRPFNMAMCLANPMEHLTKAKKWVDEAIAGLHST
jgi:hypothetical protein